MFGFNNAKLNSSSPTGITTEHLVALGLIAGFNLDSGERFLPTKTQKSCVNFRSVSVCDHCKLSITVSD